MKLRQDPKPTRLGSVVALLVSIFVAAAILTGIVVLAICIASVLNP